MNYFAVSVLLCMAVVEIASNSTYSVRKSTFSALNSIMFMNKNIPKQNDDVHTEYYFGKCATEEKELVLYDRLLYENVRGNIIIRGHFNATPERLPNCVYIKATAPFGDMVRYKAYKFTVCVIRIVVNYSGEIYYYYYYEWFIPVEMKEGIDWELYFYLA